MDLRDAQLILDLMDGMSVEEVQAVVESLPPTAVQMLLEAQDQTKVRDVPTSPLAQAQEIDEGYRERAHLRYLSDRIAAAVQDVEQGHNRYLRVSMPPRMGKSFLGSTYTPTWMLRVHPDWKLGLISHDPGLAVGWGRTVKRTIEQNEALLGVEIAKDSGAAAEWETTQGGGVVSRSTGQSITGRGFKVMIIDDAVKDFADAHSGLKRDNLWDWWLANAYTRLEPPYLVIVIGTRWHEDDLLGRLSSKEHEGDPADWEIIEFPAIAEANDVLGREPGQPLYSPIIEETEEEAISRWEGIKRTVGSYAWSALYQQRPSPSKGAIFDTDWWRYWTTVPQLAARDEEGNLDPDGRIVLVDLEKDLSSARWLDSWDMAFKKTTDSDYVVGQRWAAKGARKFLIAQTRARRSFSGTVAKMKQWCTVGLKQADGGAPYTEFVHERLVEDKANGTAVIDSLKEQIPGIVPINPTDSKEGRARSVTPTVEAGNVFLPLPSQPGNEWVVDYVSEHRDFPSGAHDDQVDAGTQALARLRVPAKSGVASPVGRSRSGGTRGSASRTQRRVNRTGTTRR